MCGRHAHTVCHRMVKLAAAHVQEASAWIPPAVQPTYTVSERQQVVKLDGFVVLCMPALFALHALDLHALPAHGACGHLLSQLTAQFGEKQALNVAKAAGSDALRFINALYDTSQQTPQLLSGCVWSQEHVAQYLQLCKYASTAYTVLHFQHLVRNSPGCARGLHACAKQELSAHCLHMQDADAGVHRSASAVMAFNWT